MKTTSKDNNGQLEFEKMPLLDPIHPEIITIYAIFKQVSEMIPLETIKKYGIIPHIYDKGKLSISVISSKKQNEISKKLKCNPLIKEVFLIFKYDNLTNDASEILNALKKYFDIEYSRNELKNLLRDGKC